MRRRPLGVLSVVVACFAAAVDQTDAFRQKFAIAGTLEVTSSEVNDQSPVDGPVKVTMRCRMDEPGTYAFHFEPVRPDGHAEDLTMTFPTPPVSPFHSVLPGGIHGGPPRVMPGGPAPTVVRDAKDPAVVTVRWGYADTGARGGLYGVKLSTCTFTEPATTQPTTRPDR